MHGADTGNLTVSVLTDVGQLLDLWSVAGDQGDAWHKRSHSVQVVSDGDVTATGAADSRPPSKRFHVRAIYMADLLKRCLCPLSSF